MLIRYDVYRVYLYVLTFSLLAMGGIALISDALPLGLHANVIAPGSALFLVLGGLATLNALHHWRVMCLLSVSLLLVMALFQLVASVESRLLLPSAVGQNHFQIQNALALVALFVAVAHFANLWAPSRKWLGRTLGLAIILVGVLSQLSFGGYAPDSARLSTGLESPIIIDLLVVMAGGGIGLLPSLVGRKQSLDRRSVFISLGGTFLTCLVGYLLSQQVVNSTAQRGEQFLSRVQVSTEQALSAQLASIQRMAARWGAVDQLPTQQLWRQEAFSYLQDFPNIELITVLDESLQIRWLEERAAEPSERFQRLQVVTAQRDWISHILMDTNEPHFSHAIPFNETSISVLLAAPFRLTDSKGIIVANLNIKGILSEALREEQSHFAVKVYQNEQLIYDSGGAEGDRLPIVLGEKTLSLHHDIYWHLIAYQNSRVMHFPAALPTLVILFGLCFSFFLALSQRLAHFANERSKHLKYLNEALVSSQHQRANLEAWNQRITRYSMDVLCTFDENGRFIQLSPSCESVFGYRPEEILGQHFSELILPEDRERTLAIFTKNLKLGGGEAPLFRNRYRHKNGNTVHIAWSAVWSEKEQSVFAIAQDVTRLAQSEAFIEGQRHILEMVSTSIPLAETLNAICEVGETRFPGTRYSVLLVDKSGKRLVHGASPSLPTDFIQKIHGMLIGPGMGTCGTAAFHQSLIVTEDIANDPHWEAYCTLALNHGLRACSSQPIKDSSGTVLGTFAIYQSEPQPPPKEQLEFINTYGHLASIAIERDRDRLSLEESEQRYRSLFDHNPNPVFSFDVEGNILSSNQSGYDLSGFTHNENVGKHFSEFVVKEDLGRVQTYYQAVLAGEPQRYEVKIQTKRGDVKEMDMVSLPVIVDGQVVGVFGVGKDITEHKAAEKALHTTLRDLERSNRDLQDFAFVASHDLQEPLRKIQAFSERLRLKAAGLDEEGRDYLGRMNSAASRMQGLIKDLLAYSRIGTQSNPYSTLDLNRILEDVLQDMDISLAASQAKIDVGVLPSIQGDMTQMRQLLQNLMSNAIKFHQKDQLPQVQVYADTVADDQWTLCVADKGIGFDEKYLDRIFNPFQRLHARQAYAGTGIGLAIVKKIAERHGAKITATSQLGQGTTFRVTFKR
ncbi:GAF domain-containing sensor histidine kinase [Vreelandella nanhaiensis]|nr:PAS domain S-box protein [Halomonas nanhaiensis]